MHMVVMNELRARTAVRSQHVRELVAVIDSDPVVTPVIEALDLYGRMGRFYYLEQLGDAPQAINPDHAWQKIEQFALADPEVDALYGQAMHNICDSDAWGKFTCALRERIAIAVERIWISIAVSGRNHVLGEVGVALGCEVHPNAVGQQ